MGSLFEGLFAGGDSSTPAKTIFDTSSVFHRSALNTKATNTVAVEVEAETDTRKVSKKKPVFGAVRGTDAGTLADEGEGSPAVIAVSVKSKAKKGKQTNDLRGATAGSSAHSAGAPTVAAKRKRPPPDGDTPAPNQLQRVKAARKAAQQLQHGSTAGVADGAGTAAGASAADGGQLSKRQKGKRAKMISPATAAAQAHDAQQNGTSSKQEEQEVEAKVLGGAQEGKGQAVDATKRAGKAFEQDDAQRLARTLFVGNLAPDVRKKAVKRLAARFGAVESVRLRSLPVRLEKKKGIPSARGPAVLAGGVDPGRGLPARAYVVFERAESVDAALQLNMTEYEGRHLLVDRAAAKSSAAAKAAGGTSSTSATVPNGKDSAGLAVPQGAAGRGGAEAEGGEEGGVGLVATAAAAAAPVEYEPSRSVFVGNLVFNAKDEELIRMFNDSAELGDLTGRVAAVRCVRDPATNIGKGFAFVMFTEPAAARAALALDGTKLHGRPLRVTRCRKAQTGGSKSGPKPASGSRSNSGGSSAGTPRGSNKAPHAGSRPLAAAQFGKGKPGAAAGGGKGAAAGSGGKRFSAGGSSKGAAWQGLVTKGARVAKPRHGSSQAAPAAAGADGGKGGGKRGAGARPVLGKRKAGDKRPAVLKRRQQAAAGGGGSGGGGGGQPAAVSRSKQGKGGPGGRGKGKGGPKR